LVRDNLLLSAYGISGFLCGLSGLTLPPLIVLVIYFDYRRDEVIAYHSVLYAVGMLCRLGTFISGDELDGNLIVYYILVLIGGTCGFLLGKQMCHYISQAFFIRVLKVFLLCIGCTFAVCQTAAESYLRFLPLVLLVGVTLHAFLYPEPNFTKAEVKPLLNDTPFIAQCA